LGVPGEESLRGKGVFDCAMCDGGQYKGGVVVVCGGGDAALTEALYMAKIASRVIVIHRRDQLKATDLLQARAVAEPGIEFVWNSVVESIEGRCKVESVKVRQVETNDVRDIRTHGVLVHVGLDPNTEYLAGIMPLDFQRQIPVNGRMETGVPFVLAAGDIRGDSPRQIAAAVGDGAIAGITAQRLLDEIG
jgi:thioredoxin reductase (NADPH)